MGAVTMEKAVHVWSGKACEKSVGTSTGVSASNCSKEVYVKKKGLLPSCVPLGWQMRRVAHWQAQPSVLSTGSC